MNEKLKGQSLFGVIKYLDTGLGWHNPTIPQRWAELLWRCAEIEEPDFTKTFLHTTRVKHAWENRWSIGDGAHVSSYHQIVLVVSDYFYPMALRIGGVALFAAGHVIELYYCEGACPPFLDHVKEVE